MKVRLIHNTPNDANVLPNVVVDRLALIEIAKVSGIDPRIISVLERRGERDVHFHCNFVRSAIEKYNLDADDAYQKFRQARRHRGDEE